MAFVLFEQGAKIALEATLNKTAPQTIELWLYTNDVTPAIADTEAAYTEASGYNYSRKTLTGASWTVTLGNPTTAAFAQQTFSFTGALGNVYGYLLVQASSGKAIGGERFSDGPYAIANNGDEIKVTPTLTCA